MNNRFRINEEEKNHIRGLHNINEQASVEGGDVFLDPNQDVGEQVDKITSQNHKDFMDGIHSMCGKMEAMGSEGKIGGRRCDGNTSDDDTDGCYGPLIALVKQYCKIK